MCWFKFNFFPDLPSGRSIFCLGVGIIVQTKHILAVYERRDPHGSAGPPLFVPAQTVRRLEAERRELLASLASTRTQIQQAYGGFNTVCDSDLIESYVFEIKALQSRYDYLLRRVKELECAP